MIILRLLYWIAGYVSIRVEGQRPERFLNLMVSNGIRVWDIRRSSGLLRAKVTLSGFRRLRPIARKARCRVRIEKKKGLPFFATKLEHRVLLAVGALAFVIALYLITSIVWIVRLTGAVAVDPGEVLKVARSYGLKPGARKAALNLREIERNIVLETKGLSWAKIRTQGTVYTIEVIEKAQKPDDIEAEGPTNVVASKDGVVVSMLVLMGRQEVREGAKVTKGQVLVSGALYGAQPPLAPGKSQTLQAPAKFLHARAIVKARVVYNAYHEVPIRHTSLVRTGRTQRGIAIRLGKTQVVWRLPFPGFAYDEPIAEPAADWLSRNTESFVEIHKVTYYELTPEIKVITREQAAEAAKKAATDMALAEVPQSAERESIDVKIEMRQDSVGATVTVTVIEEIGKPQPIAASPNIKR